MPKSLHVAVVQCMLSGSVDDNVERVRTYVIQAAQQGAKVVLVPELFETPYFCKTQCTENFTLAKPCDDHPTIQLFQAIAKQYSIAIPVSFFEKDGPCYYNSIAMLDTNGSILGVYRKSHIPDGPGYQEKYYFRPGNTGFKVWKTRVGNIGVGICWDQWFPEAARCMALAGADILLYPTAIGSEPGTPALDTQPMWRRAMIGHAVHNIIPIAAANRIGQEPYDALQMQQFYGSSFICNHYGEIITELNRTAEGFIQTSFDLDVIEADRASFGFFRDRRPELYLK